MAAPAIGNTAFIQSGATTLAINNNLGCVVAFIQTYASDTIYARATINGVEMHAIGNTQKVTDSYQKVCWFILPNAPSGSQTITFYVSGTDNYSKGAWSLGNVDWWDGDGSAAFYASGSGAQASVAVSTKDTNSLLLATGGTHTTGALTPLAGVIEDWEVTDSPVDRWAGHMPGTGGVDVIGFTAASAVWHIWAVEVNTGPEGKRADVEVTTSASFDGPSNTLAIAVGSDANYLVVGVAPRTGTGNTVSEVTYDGDAMDLLVSIANEIYLFGLHVPASGSSKNIVTTLGASGKALVQAASLSNIGVVVMTGADSGQPTNIALTPAVVGGLIWCAGQDGLADNPIIGRGGIGYFQNQAAGIALGESGYFRAMDTGMVTARFQDSMNWAVAAAFDLTAGTVQALLIG